MILAITIPFWGFFLLTSDPLGYVYKRDFQSVYVGARAVAEGHGSQLYDLELQWEITNAAISPYHRSKLLPFIYPAYVAVLLSPLGKLSLVKAFWIWTGVNLLITAWLVRRWLQLTPLFPAQGAVLVVAFFAWIPLQLTLSHGQTGLLCTVAVTEAILSLGAHETRRHWLTGCWLALGLVKPQLIAFPLLALLLFRCWRTLASFVGVLTVIFAASVAKLGFWIPDYLRFLRQFNRSGRELSLYPRAMQNWRGLASTMLGEHTGAAHFVTAGLSVVSVLVLVYVCVSRRGLTGESEVSRQATRQWQARFAIAIVLGLLTSPYLYFHDWVVAFPALTVLFLCATEWSRRENGCDWAVATLLWLIAFSPFVCFASQFQVWPNTTPIQLVPWYMGVLTALAVITMRKSEKNSPQENIGA
jgi:hypothetical protein